MKKATRILTILLVLSVVALSAKDYKIGVLAKNGAVKAMKQWGSTGDYLTKAVPDHTFQIVALGFDEVNPAIQNQDVDFFLVNSSMFVTAEAKFGAKAIATMINSKQGKALNQFGGVVITSVYNDGINSFNDLKGHSFMAVKESSFGGWQMAYMEFLNNGIDPYKDFSSVEFGNSHDNVVLAVLAGTVDAGTVRTDTIERMAAAGLIDLAEIKVIGEKHHAGFPFACSTALYPEWPFAKIKQVPDDVAVAVAKALINMPSDTKAAKDGKIVGWSTPLDYSGVEALQKKLSVGAYATK